MSAPPDMLDGLAAWVAELGHGTYRVDTPYRPGEVAIVLGDVVPQPDELLALRVYPSGGEPDSRLPFDEPYVQCRVRGGAGEAESRARARALRADLHGAGPLTLPNGVLVMSIVAVHAGVIPIGRDDAGRYEHTLNVRIDHCDPTGRRPAL